MTGITSGRGVNRLLMLFALFLSAPISLCAQIGLPGGGGIGLPGQGRRGSRRQQANQNANTATTPASYAGVLQDLDDSNLVLQLDDGRVLTIKVTSTTTFYKDSQEIQPADITLGDRWSVDATQDQQSYLYATKVTFQQAGSGDAPAQTSSGSSPSADDGRPKLKRAAPPPPDSSASGQTASADQKQPATQQPQPSAQSSGTAGPAQASSTPPTVAQTPSCENTPPVLKRGKPGTEPPCSDAPSTAASPAAAPTPAPTPQASAPAAAPASDLATRVNRPSEPLIEQAREAAFQFTGKLPNFICQEFMARFAHSSNRSSEEPLDVVSADIILDGGQESYRNVKINDRPTDRKMEDVGGSWSTGEFASTLIDLFHPDTAAQFKPAGTSSISGTNAQVYDFEVQRQHSHWMVQAGSQALATAYGGSIWIDPKTARVLRIEIQARDLPTDFPMDTVESAVDYSWVMIGGQSALLPVHAESLGCQRGTPTCSHNVIDFRNYREYAADTTITFGQ